MRRTTACLLVVLALSNSARAGSIEPIGDVATGVSADGSVVSGYRLAGDALEAFRWTTTSGFGATTIGTGLDISRDGTTVVGERFNGAVVRAIRWVPGQTPTDLGQLPGTGAAGTATASAYDVSNGGNVVVGVAKSPGGFHAFRWTPGAGMVDLGDLAGGLDSSQATAVSADGQVIVGAAEGPSGGRAVRWVGNSVVPTSLGLPPGLTGFTEAKGVSADGQVIVGVWGTGLENEAFRWTSGGGFQLLGDLPGGLRDSVGFGTNLDGSVIVGTANPDENAPDVAFYWTQSGGLRTLASVLTEAGVDLSAWRNLDRAIDMSDDGTVIIGNGTLLDGSVAGFRAVIPEPAAFSVIGVAALALRRRR